MLTNIKAAIINIVVVLVCVIGGIAFIDWYRKPKQTFQTVLMLGQNQVNGPISANVGDVLKLSVALQNKPFWLSQSVFNWQVTENGQPVNFQQIDNNDIILGAGVNPTTYTLTVNGVGLYDTFWVHPSLETLTPVTQVINVGGNSPPPNPKPPTSQLWALGIFDPSNTNAAQMAIYNSTTIEGPLLTSGFYWHAYKTTDVVPTTNGSTGPVSSTKWGKAAAAVGLPALILIDSNGNVLSSVALPSTESLVINAVIGSK